MEAGQETAVLHPNREKPESKATKAFVTFLLIVSAGLLALITWGGWGKFQGALGVHLFYIAVYLIFAFYVSRWNRGVLPVASAFALILIIFAGVAAPAWFTRDNPGFDQPALPESALGLLTLLVIPVQLLLIAFAMRGFQQQWSVVGGSRADLEARRIRPGSSGYGDIHPNA